MKSEEFKASIKASGLSQRELARRLAVDADTVGRWVAGKTPVPGYAIEYLRVLALALQITRGPQ